MQAPERIRPPRSLPRAGFTLIEIMVVLAIIGGVMAVVAPKLINPKSKMKDAVREFATVTRDVHNAARLFNSTYRIVVKFDEKDGHSYSIESAPGNVTSMSEEQERALEKDMSSAKEKLEEKNQFSEDARIIKKPVRLPKNFYVGAIEFGGRSKAISEGVARIYFYPQGLTDQALVHFTDRKTLNWTVTLHPITGRAHVYERKVELRELRE